MVVIWQVWLLKQDSLIRPILPVHLETSSAKPPGDTSKMLKQLWRGSQASLANNKVRIERITGIQSIEREYPQYPELTTLKIYLHSAVMCLLFSHR